MACLFMFSLLGDKAGSRDIMSTIALLKLDKFLIFSFDKQNSV